MVTQQSPASMDAAPASMDEEQCEYLFGHPKGLYVLVLTEMWERFSFYGMRGLLVFFLIDKFRFSDSLSFATYGGYTALVYVSPLIGGMIADRYLGFSRAVVFGGMLMLVGHLGLALEDLLFVTEVGTPAGLAPAQLQLFHLSLAFLIVGVGLLKPNISAMVGGLYPKGGHLRDSGFTVFVSGINVGATVSAVLCGYVGQKYGWGYGFGLSALGMAAGLCVFVGGRRHLKGIGEPPAAARLHADLIAGLNPLVLIYLATLLAVLAVWQLMQMLEYLGFIVGLTFVGAAIGVLGYAFRRLERMQRQQLFSALMLMAIWVCFAAIIEQVGSSISLFTQRAVDRTVFGIEIQPAQLHGLLPFLVIVFSPVFAWWWGYLERRNRNPSTPAKFALSLLLLGVGYAALALGALWPDESARVSLIWVVLLYIFFAVGDLFIVPVGLSAVTKLAAREVVGFMMGLWMLSVAIGNYFSALIAQYSALPPEALAKALPEEILLHYQTFFAYLALGATLLGVLALLCAPAIRKWMYDVR